MHLLSPTSKSLASRRAAEAWGRAAETAVAQDWQARGYDVLARRHRNEAGEIDLIVADAETLVFVEVKARKGANPVYAVQPRQQRRLLLAAELAIAAHQGWQRPTMRFDVALVSGGAIEHIEDAIRYN